MTRTRPRRRRTSRIGARSPRPRTVRTSGGPESRWPTIPWPSVEWHSSAVQPSTRLTYGVRPPPRPRRGSRLPAAAHRALPASASMSAQLTLAGDRADRNRCSLTQAAGTQASPPEWRPAASVDAQAHLAGCRGYPVFVERGSEECPAEGARHPSVALSAAKSASCQLVAGEAAVSRGHTDPGTGTPWRPRVYPCPRAPSVPAGNRRGDRLGTR
jgi:hypothetical protein